jgi:hypothetical protein
MIAWRAPRRLDFVMAQQLDQWASADRASAAVGRAPTAGRQPARIWAGEIASSRKKRENRSDPLQS